MEEKKISEQESLQIIQQMIQKAKQEQRDDGRKWIIWGWLLFIASLLTFINMQYHWYSDGFFWNIFGGIVLLWLLYVIVRNGFFKMPYRVRTYTTDLFSKLNSGFFIFLILIISAMNLGVAPSKGFMLLVGLYGFWILVYGTALNFKPSIIAAYITWTIAFAGLFVDKFEKMPDKQFQWIMLFHAVAVLCGYIIPGHIANKEFNKSKRGNIS